MQEIEALFRRCGDALTRLKALQAPPPSEGTLDSQVEAEAASRVVSNMVAGLAAQLLAESNAFK
jgi:hypothetical protein